MKFSGGCLEKSAWGCDGGSHEVVEVSTWGQAGMQAAGCSPWTSDEPIAVTWLGRLWQEAALKDEGAEESKSDHRMPGWLKLEGTLGDLPLQPPAPGSSSQSLLLKATCIQALKEEIPCGCEKPGRLYWQERLY